MQKNKMGFTLVELIMVIVISGIIAGVVAPFLSNAFRAWFLVRSEREAVFHAGFAMNRLAREIRETRDNGSIGIFTATEFAFTDTYGNYIDFRQSGNQLLRNADELTGILKNPGGLTFEYLDQNGNTTAVKGNIRMVRITLITTDGNISFTLQSIARLRN